MFVWGPKYTVFGDQGKQGRDNIHAKDVATLIQALIDNPRCGEVSSLAPSSANSCSGLEAFSMAELPMGIPMPWKYRETDWEGAHSCCCSDLTRTLSHYADWNVTVSLETAMQQLWDRWDQGTSE